MTAQPIVMEPVYLVDIKVSQNKIGTIYSCFGKKRGHLISEQNSSGSLNNISYLPMSKSIGFNEYSREQPSYQL